MTDHELPTFVRGGPACAFCAQALSEADAIAAIRLTSHTYGQRSFGAHALCLRQAMHPDIVRFLDLADVTPGRELLLRT